MSWLQENTGLSDREWIEYVQQLIREHSVPSSDPNHDETEVTAWIHELTVKVATIPTESQVDGNMFVSRIMSAVLALWYHNVQFAKTRDPRRPIQLRLKAVSRLSKWRIGLAKIAMDRNDEIKDIFSGQDWEDPKDKNATDGTFV